MQNTQTESPQTRVVNEFAHLARSYDTRWPFYIEATTRETIAHLSLHAEDQLLDIGCGTGALLGYLSAIHPAAQLVGVDPVPEMLATARRKLPCAVGLHEGWAEQLPFADAQFDIAVSCSMFHYIDRPIDALAEIQRVLRPGGQLIITDWCGDYLMCRLFERCQWLHRRAYARIYKVRDCKRLLEQAGYAEVVIDSYKINWRWGLMTARCSRAPA